MENKTAAAERVKRKFISYKIEIVIRFFQMNFRAKWTLSTSICSTIFSLATGAHHRVCPWAPHAALKHCIHLVSNIFGSPLSNICSAKRLIRIRRCVTLFLLCRKRNFSGYNASEYALACTLFGRCHYIYLPQHPHTRWWQHIQRLCVFRANEKQTILYFYSAQRPKHTHDAPRSVIIKWKLVFRGNGLFCSLVFAHCLCILDSYNDPTPDVCI